MNLSSGKFTPEENGTPMSILPSIAVMTLHSSLGHLFYQFKTLRAYDQQCCLFKSDHSTNITTATSFATSSEPTPVVVTTNKPSDAKNDGNSRTSKFTCMNRNII